MAAIQIKILPTLPVPPDPERDNKQAFIAKAEAFTKAQKVFGDQLNSDTIPNLNKLSASLTESVNNAAASASSAAQSASQAAASANTAKQQATAAAASASAAKASQTAAAASATAAKASQDAAAASASSALTSKNAAATSAASASKDADDAEAAADRAEAAADRAEEATVLSELEKLKEQLADLRGLLFALQSETSDLRDDYQLSTANLSAAVAHSANSNIKQSLDIDALKKSLDAKDEQIKQLGEHVATLQDESDDLRDDYQLSTAKFASAIASAAHTNIEQSWKIYLLETQKEPVPLAGFTDDSGETIPADSIQFTDDSGAVVVPGSQIAATI